MPENEFKKQKEVLINGIRTEITEEKELNALINQFDKIIKKRTLKAKKAQEANRAMAQLHFSKTRASSITSLQSENNITHEEALQELHKMTELWK